MKVTFKCNIESYSGTMNDMTYGSYRDGNVCIGRKWVMPAPTPQQGTLGSAGKNLSSLYKGISTAYKADLKAYATRYGREHVSENDLPPNAYAIFIRLMYAYQKSDSEHVNLATVEMSDLTGLDAPVLTIKDAVDAGLLQPVNGFADLTATM